ncbi:MAG: NADH-quinone oxidoreductase subunit M [Ardenticatenaceae bacterium]|nr:NADH-quinone oxidoreductase subunit M [Ardenticatenaceae bacterium]
MTNSIVLTLLMSLPLVGVVVILFLPVFNNQTDFNIKFVANATAIITLLFSIAILPLYDMGVPTLQLEDTGSWIDALGVTYHVGVDGLSILMILLTTFISAVAIGSSWNGIDKQVKQYYIFMLLLETGMLGVFLAQDLFLFYIFWEFTLVPMYFLIGIWGGKERVYASIKFFLYTMAGSLLMLIAILYVGIQAGTFNLPELIANRELYAGAQQWLFWGFAIAFAIKVPVFPFHSWLPDAHTQAPTAGSIVLAGVLLKMGTYGFMRFNLPMFPEASTNAAPIMATLAIIGIIYGAIVSFAQTDVKKLVAYSSISHLGFVMLGIFSLNEIGIQGAILQGVNHGLSTGALFFLVGVIYEQRHTREISEFGGLWRAMPVFAVTSLIVTLSSMGLPGLNGFVGEFSILLASTGSDALGDSPWIYTAFATSGVILAAIYLLKMYQGVFMGPLDNPKNQALRDMNRGELAIMLSFLLFIVWIGIAPSIWFASMDATVADLIQNVVMMAGG